MEVSRLKVDDPVRYYAEIEPLTYPHFEPRFAGDERATFVAVLLNEAAGLAHECLHVEATGRLAHFVVEHLEPGGTALLGLRKCHRTFEMGDDADPVTVEEVRALECIYFTPDPRPEAHEPEGA